MINEITSQKGAFKPEKNITVSKNNTIQSAKPLASAQNTVTRSAMSLAANAGLPADRLSASIVLFARYFSLPLKPNLLAAIRQQAFIKAAHQGTANPASLGQREAAAATDLKSTASLASSRLAVSTPEIIRAREALSFAAAASESKGAELSPKGLETYAEAIDPDYIRKDEDHQHDRRKKNNNEKTEKESIKIESITADKLKQMYFEYTKNNPLIDFLNKLPGKNGQRWIVLPFDFFDNENHFKVSIRILLDDKNAHGCAVKMAIQITMDREQRTDSNEQKWLFVLESSYQAYNTKNKIGKVVVYFRNDMTIKEQECFKKELSVVLEIPIKTIYVKCGAEQLEETFPCEAGCDDQFPLIDEAV